ncbi:hypothetical protein FF1_006836 [Malus domestica]
MLNKHSLCLFNLNRCGGLVASQKIIKHSDSLIFSCCLMYFTIAWLLRFSGETQPGLKECKLAAKRLVGVVFKPVEDAVQDRVDSS